MLSQTGGTLAQPVPIGDFEDAKHYRIPQPADATTVYELLLLTPPGGDTQLFGFASCHRFVGKFHVRQASIEVVIDTEGLSLAPGESWKLESFLFATGPDRNELLGQLASALGKAHPRLEFSPVPTGWCSWYCYGPMVTKQRVSANLDVVREQGLGLRYIQIDDGYQAAMGDWLDTSPTFGGGALGQVKSALGLGGGEVEGVQGMLKTIRDAKSEPAIWVAPFIAEEGSKVFKEHPDWFVKDETGAPLRSDTVTFGGWRRGPWYALDGTHPEAQAHLEQVFRTMRTEWGCSYFKLDANFWGAIHGGRFHDPKATRVEAYRRGMAAVLRGAGDAFILGCNHPLWPSLGVIHGARSSGDINRSWQSFTHTARETFHRNWQNGTFWWNDPDCVLLTGNLPENGFVFHATVIFAAGGMTLSGDDMTKLAPERMAMLRKLLPPTGVPAKFTDASLQVGVVETADLTQVCFFNWGEQPCDLSYPLASPMVAADFWTGVSLGEVRDALTVSSLPPHSARLITLRAPGK